MSMFANFQEAFKYVEKVKLPDKICGVDIPDAQVGDIVKVAEGVVTPLLASLVAVIHLVTFLDLTMSRAKEKFQKVLTL